MKTKLNFICIFIMLFFRVTLSAQQADTTGSGNTHFKLGIFYNSNLHYYGRTDSLRSSGVFPLAELWFNKNLYINGAPIFVNNNIANFQYAGSVVTLGYMAKSKNENFLTNLYITKPLYKDNSNLVQSSLKAQGSASFSWLSKMINLNAGGDIKISDKVDYGISAGLDRLFRIDLPEEFIIAIDPSFTMSAGTQQFTKTYYKKSNFLLFPGVDQQVTNDVSKLNILAYEFSMPIVFAKNKLQIIMNPAYVIPQNLITVENRPDLSERGQNMFYITAGLKITF